MLPKFKGEKMINRTMVSGPEALVTRGLEKGMERLNASVVKASSILPPLPIKVNTPAYKYLSPYEPVMVKSAEKSPVIEAAHIDFFG